MKLPLITATVIAVVSAAQAAVTPPVVTATTVTQVYTKDIITPPVVPNVLVPAPAPYDTTTTRTTWSDTAVFLKFDGSLGTLNSVTITQDASIYGRIAFVGTGTYDLDLILGVVANTSAFATRNLTASVDDHQVGVGNHIETITFQDSDVYPDPTHLPLPDPAINPALFIGTGVEPINIPVRASGSTTDSSDNTIQSAYAAFAGAKITLVYNYTPNTPPCEEGVLGGVDLGGIINNYLFLFTDGSKDANWQGATKGFAGNVAIDGILAKERTSGGVAYAGTIQTSDSTLGAWQNIVNQNPGQAFASYNETVQVGALKTKLTAAFSQIDGLPVTPGYANVSATSLNGLNTQNGIAETFVINVRSGFQVSSQIKITGDASDVFILRWDTDANPANGYQGTVKFQSGGAIVPLGGLTAGNFIHVAGDIDASGGGNTPPAPYPQGPRFNNGQGALIPGAADFHGGGFFTGYWLTTGDPVTGETHSLSNAIFVGGWYTTTTKFSMTSGTSGVYVAPNCP